MRAEAVLALLALALGPGHVAGPAEPRAERIVVASKNFAESRILGEVMTLLLAERTGLEVEHKSGLSGTLICHTALVNGDVDLYAEYTGTAWAIVLEETDKVTDPLQVYLRVQEQYRARYDLEWLAPFGFANTYALAMREPRAEELGIRTLSDLAVKGGGLSAGFSPEFIDREDGWAGLAPFYGLKLAGVRGMEHGLLYAAVASGELDLLDAYSTDGKLLRHNLRTLIDDRAFFPPYDAAPIVRRELLRARPEVGAALAELAFLLDEDRMIRLNWAVEVEGRDFREVARTFLAEEGLAGEHARPVAVGRRGDGRGFWTFFLGRWRKTLDLVGEHLLLTFVSVFFAAAIAVPLGIVIARRPWAARIGLGLAGVLQTIPSLALLAILIAVPGLGLSFHSAIVALTIYAVLPILRNTFTGLRDVDPLLIDTATALGLSERDLLLRIQLPLATRTIMAGIRTAAVVTVGFATLAAFIGAGGLGEPIIAGLSLNDTHLILTGALPAAALALLTDFLLGRLELVLTPRGLRD